MNEKLTDEQIKNWRKVLIATVGPYALIMPKEDVQKLHDKMQNEIDQKEKSKDETQ